jgi:arylsulfatase
MEADPLEQNDLSQSPEHEEEREWLTSRLIGELYGGDEAWVQDGQLVGTPDREFRPGPNRGLSGQRGTHWPPPPLDLRGKQVGMPG